MSGKVIPFPTPDLPAGGTFSNILTPPKTSEEMMRDLRNALAVVKRSAMHVVPERERFVLPPDWETSLHPALVAEIKRRCGIV